MNARARSRQGWTLLEILVAITIIGVLVALMLTAIVKVRERANLTVCHNNLKQMGLALQSYYTANGQFPSGYLFDPPAKAALAPVGRDITMAQPGLFTAFVRDRRPPPPPQRTTPEAPGWGWATMLLPHLDQAPLFDRIDFKVSVDSPAVQPIRSHILAIYTCPTDQNTGIYTITDGLGQAVPDIATNSYAACYGALRLIDYFPHLGTGLFGRNTQYKQIDVPDGLSNTLAIGERANLLVQTPWAGVMPSAQVTTMPGAPVFATITQGAPVQVLARISKRSLLDPNSEPYDFFSAHPPIVHFAFADGSVRAITSSVSVPVLQALATRAGNEAVSPGDY